MNWKKLSLLAMVLATVALFYFYGLEQYFTPQAFQAERAALAGFYHAHPFVTILVFIAVFALQTALFLPADLLLTMIGGALFGTIMGALCSYISLTAGAALSFLMARYVLRDSVRKRFGRRLEAVNREMEREGTHYIIFLRLVQVFPFFLVTLLASVTGMSIRKFLVGTMVGIVPGNLLFSNAGASLATVQTAKDILTPRVIMSFTLLGLFFLVPVVYRKIRDRKK